MFTTPEWLWIIAIIAAISASVGISIISLVSSSERKLEAFVMLPPFLQPDAPPTTPARVFQALFGISLLCFYGALIALLLTTKSWIPVVVGGVALLIAKFKGSSYWTRNGKCRPMLPMLGWSALLIVTGLVALIDITVL